MGVYQKINRRKIQVSKVPSEATQQGYEHRISLSELSAKAQAKYYHKFKNVSIPEKPAPAQRLHDKSLDDLSDRQREQAAHWRRILDDWRRTIAEFPKQKTEKTKEFVTEYNRWHPHLPLTERTLFHKWKLFRDLGEVALADGRADRADKGSSKIPEIAWSVFLQWWLDEAQPTVLHCHNLLLAWAKLDMPELLPLPAVDSFYRETKKIPKAVLDYFRSGKKKLEDEAMPFVRRIYEFLDSNDVWVADFHTLDIMVRDDWTRRVFRPHVVVWQDIRSRKTLAIHLCESSNSDGVIIAFRKAVEKWGVPKAVYLDNGREFLVSDFGGRGKRKTSESASYGTSILGRLQVDMVNAKVGNAKAKIVERAFREFKEQFSRLILTYTGGRPDWKPERLEGILKKDKDIPLLSEIAAKLETYAEGWYNMKESSAAGLNGLTPNACYEQNLVTKRTATEDQLNLMLLRSAKSQLVDRNGVYLKFGDIKLWFTHPDLIFGHLKKPVYVRYNPENLSSVRVYDEDERFLLTAEWLDAGGYGGEQDLAAIKRVAAMRKKQREQVTGYMEQIAASIQAPAPMDVLMRASQANIEADQARSYDAGVLEPVRYDERRSAMAAGAEDDNLIDLSRMIENAKKRGDRGE